MRRYKYLWQHKQCFHFYTRKKDNNNSLSTIQRRVLMHYFKHTAVESVKNGYGISNKIINKKILIKTEKMITKSKEDKGSALT